MKSFKYSETWYSSSRKIKVSKVEIEKMASRGLKIKKQDSALWPRKFSNRLVLLFGVYFKL